MKRMAAAEYGTTRYATSGKVVPTSDANTGTSTCANTVPSRRTTRTTRRSRLASMFIYRVSIAFDRLSIGHSASGGFITNRFHTPGGAVVARRHPRTPERLRPVAAIVGGPRPKPQVPNGAPSHDGRPLAGSAGPSPAQSTEAAYHRAYHRSSSADAWTPASQPVTDLSSRTQTSTTRCAAAGRRAQVLGSRGGVGRAATGTPSGQPPRAHLQPLPHARPRSRRPQH